MKNRIMIAMIIATSMLSSCKDETGSRTTGSITGTVSDTNGSPLSGVTINISPNYSSYYTSSDGSYSFQSLDAGSYSLSYIKYGYIEATKTCTVSTGTSTTADVWLTAKGAGGGTGEGGGSGTGYYTITNTSVCAIYALDDSKTGTKYTKSWYKWETSTGRVILSISKTDSAYWIGVASKNYDSSCKSFSVGSYTYKVVDYTPVGGAWYYYFN